MSRVSLSSGLHISVATALLLDCAVVGLSAYVRTHNVVLSSFTLYSINIQAFLPAVASGAAGIIAAFNVYAFSLLVISYARQQIVRKGLTFQQIDHLYKLSNGGFPLAFTSLALLALVFHGSVMLLSPALVSSMTPTRTTVNTTSSYPLPSFGTLSDSLNITCAWPTVPPLYGYGINCALNEKFGVVVDAGMGAITNTIPVNYTRNGVTYPSDLQGISGIISTLGPSLALASNYSQSQNLGSSIINTCVPRMVINVTCESLTSAEPHQELNQTGYSYNFTRFDQVVPSQDLSINEAFLYKNDNSTTFNALTAPDYGTGSVFVFGDTDHQTGFTKLILLFYGEYILAATSPVMACDVIGVETMIPVQILGETFIQQTNNDVTCAHVQPASPQLIGNLTYMAQMVLQKSQGQDGQLGFITEIQNGSVSDAFGGALTRMVSAGATEMYTALDINSAPTRPVSQSYTFFIPETLLGGPTQPWGWLVGPLVLIILLLVSWVLCIKIESNLRSLEGFNPLHPVTMIITGINSHKAVLPQSTPPKLAEVSAKEPSVQCKAVMHRFKVGDVEGVAQLDYLDREGDSFGKEEHQDRELASVESNMKEPVEGSESALSESSLPYNLHQPGVLTTEPKFYDPELPCYVSAA